MVDTKNTGNRQPTRVGQRAGTRHQVVEGDTLSAPRVLERDNEVVLVYFSQAEDGVGDSNLYEAADGTTILVRDVDEIRDAYDDEDDDG